MEAQKHISLRDYGRVIRKRWRLISVFALLGLVIGLIMYRTATPAYLASSEVLIERPSGYVISATIGGLGTATSTKQQLQFLATPNYQQLARSLTEIGPMAHVDLQDQAVLDDISTVIQSDILNCDFVTPVRLVMYDLPSPSLLSFQQAQTLAEAPDLGHGLVLLGHMAIGPDFNLYQGWERGRPGTSDRHVWDNLTRIANTPLMRSLATFGISDQAAEESASVTDANRRHLITGQKLRMAAQDLSLLSDLDTRAKTHLRFAQLTSPSEILAAAGKIMQSTFVAGLKNGPGRLDWFSLSPAQKRAALDRTRDALNVYLSGPGMPRAETVRKVSGKEVEDSTDIVQISNTAEDPYLARTGANAMAAVMVWEDRMTKVAESERSARFLQKQLGDENSGATLALRQTEDALTRFRKANNLLDIDSTLKTAVQQAADLDAQKGEVEATIRETGASYKKTVDQLGGTEKFDISPTIRQNPLVESIRGNLIQAESDLAGLKAKGYTDAYPGVQQAQARIKSLQNQLTQEVRTTVEQQYTPDPVHLALAEQAAGLAAKQVGLEARQTVVNQLLDQMNSRFSSLPDKQADLVRLMRSFTLAEQQYNALYLRLLDAQNNKAMRQGNARVVQPALNPGDKVSPRMRHIIMAVVLGMFLGVLCALALSTTDTHLRTAEDVRRELDLPVLAHLPAIPKTNALVVESMPAAAITEGFRALRSTIRFMGADAPIRTLVATSTRAAEGKSTVVANLAASLAQAGLTVTAVDADLRRPRLASFFGVPASTGLADVLSGAQTARQVRQATRIPGLYIVPAGPASSNPGELLDNNRIARALEDLQEGNDIIVVDTPPVGVVTDAALVGSAADATVLVIESGTTEPDEARAALARLTQTARAKVLGVVLVGGEAPISDEYVRYVSAPNGDGNGFVKAGGHRKARG